MSNLIPDDVEQMHSVKIDYVSTRVEKEDLEKLFGKYGRVGDVYLPSHPNGDRKGFAFVRYYKKQDAEDAVRELEGYELEGKTLKCMLATVDSTPTCAANPRAPGSSQVHNLREGDFLLRLAFLLELFFCFLMFFICLVILVAVVASVLPCSRLFAVTIVVVVVFSSSWWWWWWE
ncbi:SRSF2 [Symbiodinium natans]|uniref:SRSF2 protein n=1 Tax=Symbiodinium natans TaxID=878477 RepID=A0A812RLR3_9DINO|nr:SRSF2 [Symbiodinium natans]